MNHVMTVTGPVPAGELGITLMHEHVILDHEQSYRGGFIARLEDPEVAVAELSRFRAAGGRALVELTTGDVGRDPALLRRISADSGVHIIASTGYYTEQVYRPEVHRLTIDRLALMMIDEITVGIADTGVRAGIIGELGTRRRFITPAEERVFRAAARSQLATGVAISTHTYWGGELAIEQARVLKDEGVSPDRIIIGHLGDRRDNDYHVRIADEGVWIQFDHIGKTEYLADRERARMIVDLVGRGLADRILLSCDLSYRSELATFGGIGYAHLLTVFVPLLREEGLDDAVITQLLVDNPRRALVIDAPSSGN